MGGQGLDRYAFASAIVEYNKDVRTKRESDGLYSLLPFDAAGLTIRNAVQRLGCVCEEGTRWAWAKIPVNIDAYIKLKKTKILRLQQK